MNFSLLYYYITSGVHMSDIFNKMIHKWTKNPVKEQRYDPIYPMPNTGDIFNKMIHKEHIGWTITIDGIEVHIEGPWRQFPLSAVIVGRFQPFTQGHVKLIKMIKQNKVFIPVIAIVKRTRSNLCGRNPFLSDYMKDFIYRVTDNVPVIEVHNANIIEIAHELHRNETHLGQIVCGDDRVQSYTKMIQNYGHKSPHIDNECSVYYMKRDDISGTFVRQMIRDNQAIAFRGLMPKRATPDDFDEMRKIILERDSIKNDSD